MLFAAEGADYFLGNAGWASFGLAGLVVSWLLLKYLPAQEKKIEKMNLAHAAEIKELNAKHDEDVIKINLNWLDRSKESQKSFQDALERIHLHNKEMIQMLFRKSGFSHRLGRSNEKDTEE